jgi:fluoride exporter
MVPAVPLLVAVGAGGALGSIARYLVVIWAGQTLGSGFPFGTLIVNIVGGFAMGLIAESSALVWTPSPELRVFLMTGVLGGFTTFSSFALDVSALTERGDIGVAFTYAAASVLFSIAGLYAGLRLVRAIAGVS